MKVRSAMLVKQEDMARLGSAESVVTLVLLV